MNDSEASSCDGGDIEVLSCNDENKSSNSLLCGSGECEATGALFAVGEVISDKGIEKGRKEVNRFETEDRISDGCLLGSSDSDFSTSDLYQLATTFHRKVRHIH